MKYWLFQNNQVSGPYEPGEMEKIPVFAPESLVCPEGRRGTSVGDWQRAGMVPDLSAALVRASVGGGHKTAVLPVRQEAAARERETDELKRQIAGLEERLSSVRLLSETLDKAVEEERRVEQDVEKQGRTLADLARVVDELRSRLDESKAPQEEPSAAAPASEPSIAAPAASSLIEFPAINAELRAPLDAWTPAMPAAAAPKAEALNFSPMTFDEPSTGAQASVAAPDLPPAPKSKKAWFIGGMLGLAALGGLAVMGGLVPGLRKPQPPAAMLEPAPPAAPAPQPLWTAAPDPRELAIDFAKAWPLSGARRLGRVLEDLAPPSGNLSPWMADPLAGNRVQVNYFARSSAPDAPTIAYEFEVDLDGETLVGRNAAAKSVLTGKAAAPPAPPKRKPVKVKPKALRDTASPLPGFRGSTLLEPPAEKTPRPKRGAPSAAAPSDETLLDDLLKE